MNLFEITNDEKTYFVAASTKKKAKTLVGNHKNIKKINKKNWGYYFIKGQINEITNPTLKTVMEFNSSERIIFSFYKV